MFIFQLFSAVSIVEGKEKKPIIRIIYMTKNQLVNEKVYFIEATLAAFASKTEIISANDFNQKTVKYSDILVFVGDTKDTVPQAVQETFRKHKGKIIALGENVEQLFPFKSWGFLGEGYIRNLDGQELSSTIPVVRVIPPKGSEIISMGEDFTRKYPFVVKKGSLSYIATTSFDIQQKYSITRGLYTILEQKQPDVHPAFIRLEDISPLTDPNNLKEAGEYLANRGIPFYMSVVPVALSNKNGKLVTFSQNKKLLNVIKKLQTRGGMIIVNGYSRSYRFEEKGDGFEFWDVKMNQRIITEKTDQIPPKQKVRSDFPSEKEYEKYIVSTEEIETEYIEKKLTKSIEELTDLGLYPVAFEAPNYAMSSNGYRTASKFFSTIFGQIQLSDEDRSIVGVPLLIAEPKVLAGMRVYPDTIGFINPALSDPLQDMRLTIRRLQTVPGSMIGGYYHSYLGSKYLPQMIELIESVPNIDWLNLKRNEYLVKTEKIMIKQEVEKPINIISNKTYADRLLQQMKDKPFDFLLWVLVGVVSVTITVFLVYILRLKTQLRKRLFEERKNHG